MTNMNRRWCFYINLPIGAVTILLILIFFQTPDQKIIASEGWKSRFLQLDPFGTAAFLPGIVCLLLALQWGGSTYPWKNWRIILLFVIAGVLIIAFVGLQVWGGDNATVPIRIIKQRSVLGAAIFALFIGASFFIFVYYIPIWFQAIKEASAMESGIRNLPMILGVVIFSLIAGGLITYVGYYLPAFYFSTVLAAIGAGLLTTFQVDTNHSKWIGYQAIYGFGIGAGLQNTLLVVQTVLPLKDVAIGSAVIVFSQTLGGALFIAVAQNVFQNRLIAGLRETVPSLDANIVLQAGATSLKDAIPSQFLEGVQIAYNSALTQTWYVALAGACLTAVGTVMIEWKSVKDKKTVPAVV